MTKSKPLWHTLKADAHRAICGAAAIPLAPVVPECAGVQCTHAVGAIDDSTVSCPWVKFSLQLSSQHSNLTANIFNWSFKNFSVGEPIYYHGLHELCINTGGPQNQL